MKKSFFLLICALLVSSCNAPAPQENRPSGLKNMATESKNETVFDNLDNEPNDSLYQAQTTPLEFKTDEFHFTGELTPNDVDTWLIKAKNGTIVDITVTPENFDVIADVAPLPEESARRFYDEHTVDEAENMTNVRLTPQGVYLTVRGRNAQSVPYTVTIKRLMPAGDEILEQEPNDQVTSAQPIWLERELTATLNPSDDVDVYKLNLNKAGVLTCQFGDTPTSLKLLQNNKVIYQGESKPGEELKTLPFEANADLFAQIEALQPGKDATRYTCRLMALDAMPNEIEPNDTLETAQRLADMPEDIEFSFAAATDIDIFRMATPTEPLRRYTARIEVDQLVTPTLNVLTPAGTPIIQANGATACLFGTEPGQDILLRVAHAPTTRNYPIPYHLKMNAFDATAVEMEPNNAMQNANELLVGTPKSGFIFPENDVDIYKVEIPATDGVQSGHLEISTESGYISKLSLRLQDAAGFEISRADSQQASKPLNLAFDAPVGTYYVVVTGQGDQCLKPYTLSVAFTPTPGELSETGEAPSDAALAALQQATAEQPGDAPSPGEQPGAAPILVPMEQPSAAPSPAEQPSAAPSPAEQPSAAPSPAEQPGAAQAPAEQPGAAQAPAEQPSAAPDDIPLDALLKAAATDTNKPAQAPANDDDAF